MRDFKMLFERAEVLVDAPTIFASVLKIRSLSNHLRWAYLVLVNSLVLSEVGLR